MNFYRRNPEVPFTLFVVFASFLYLFALPARADFLCDDGTTKCLDTPAAHVNATAQDVIDTRALLVAAETKRDDALNANERLATELLAAQAAASGPSWGTVAQASGLALAVGVVVGLLLHR